jgi:4-alpha-glucanotransferase
MKKRSLVLGAFNHIAPGLGNEEFERLYQRRLKPLLSRLNEYQRIPVVLHLSGTLLQRLESRHPEYLSLLKEMADRKQVELLGGGYSHPFLPLIPLSDRLGQIEQLTTEIRRSLGKKPRGCILPDFAWEQQLASTLQTAGMDYTFLGERQFIQAGASADLPCVTEDQGRTILVYPVVQGLEKGLPQDIDAFFANLSRRLMPEDATICVLLKGSRFFDVDDEAPIDAPLKQFFEKLQAFSADCELTTPTRLLKNSRRYKRAYFISDSVRESIIASPAVAGLYAKMQYVNSLVNQLRGDKARKKSAREEIWKAQDSELYKLGRDSGVSPQRMRSVAYKSLLEAERITREKSGFLPSIAITDYDFDGYDEYLYQGNDYNAYMHLEGAVLTEFDVISTATNLLNIPENGNHRSSVFRDGISGQERDRVIVLEDGLYSLEERNRNHCEIKFSFEGMVSLGAKPQAIRVEKRFVFKKNACQAEIALTNIGTSPIAGRYHSISQLSTLYKESSICRLSVRTQAGEQKLPEKPTFRIDEALAVLAKDEKEKDSFDIVLANPAHVAIELLSDGKELARSGALFDFSWPISLEPTERFETSIQLLIYPRKS